MVNTHHPSPIPNPRGEEHTGFNAANASARSTRNPFFLPFHVGGNKLTRLKSNPPSSAPAASNVIANVLLLFAALFFGTSTYSCCVHSPFLLFDLTSTLPNTSFPPSADCSDAVNTPLYAPRT